MTTAIVIGAGQRGNAYSPHALSFPNELKIIGVAEPHEKRRKDFAEKYSIEHSNSLSTWEDVFTKEKWADAVIISTPDHMHFAPAMAAIEKGYNILLEKPIAPTAEECKAIAKAAKEKGVKVVVCHVMRYSPFAKVIKDIVANGELGDIMSIVHNENVGNTHHAHSFVRGNWNNAETSCPMILAKCCHDMDFIQWLINKKCVKLTSFGSLSHFNLKNKPANSPDRCTDGCTVKSCPYDSRKLYLHGGSEWFRSVAAGHFNATDEEVAAALKTGPYGRCVYKCDNNVVDHQVVSMLFEDDITVNFAMTAFTPDTSRSLKIMGTKGQLKAHTSDENIKVCSFLTGETRSVKTDIAGGHGGGDKGIIAAFCKYVQGEDISDISEISISTENHMLCFAAEESRLSGGKVVSLK